MHLPRGFKAQADRIARDVRSRLGLPVVARLQPQRLADLLGIPLIPLSSLRDAAPRVVDYFTDPGRDVFSALTLFVADERAIVFNDAHSAARQASDITHELAHDLLGHTPQPAVDEFGCRRWNRDHEEQADWLAGTLLVPQEAAYRSVRLGLTVGEAAWCYRVSAALMRWRMNVTGAERRAAPRA